MKNAIIKITKDQYPVQLQEIHNPPKEMSMLGTLPGPENKFITIIGARDYSEYGQTVCSHLIQGLKDYPIVVVSGLAIGIDSLVHEAALNFGIKTIAFPGSGLSSRVLYPPSRRNLAKRILDQGGALISPFDLNQLGAYWTFPARNRLMAGISQATLIIEARKGSGTLLTAEYATEFNRDIMTVPGNIFSELSYGPHMLIKRGAIPVTSSRDILEALGFETASLQTSLELPATNSIISTLSPDQRTIYGLLQRGPMTGSDLVEQTKFSSSKFNVIISELELQGLVEEFGGKYKVRSCK